MSRRFTAAFPYPIKNGDSVRLKGNILKNAKLFSINFIIDIKPAPQYIPYHFKTQFNIPKSIGVQHNHKYNDWGTEIVDQQTWVDGPGESFDVEFIFNNNSIGVYTDAGAQYNFKFRASDQQEQIKAVQIWDDLDYLESIEFKFKHSPERNWTVSNFTPDTVV